MSDYSSELFRPVGPDADKRISDWHNRSEPYSKPQNNRKTDSNFTTINIIPGIQTQNFGRLSDQQRHDASVTWPKQHGDFCSTKTTSTWLKNNGQGCTRSANTNYGHKQRYGCQGKTKSSPPDRPSHWKNPSKDRLDPYVSPWGKDDHSHGWDVVTPWVRESTWKLMLRDGWPKEGPVWLTPAKQNLKTDSTEPPAPLTDGVKSESPDSHQVPNLDSLRAESACLSAQLRSTRNVLASLFSDVSIVDGSEQEFADVRLVAGPDQAISSLRHDAMKILRHSLGLFESVLSPDTILGNKYTEEYKNKWGNFVPMEDYMKMLRIAGSFDYYSVSDLYITKASATDATHVLVARSRKSLWIAALKKEAGLSNRSSSSSSSV